MNESIYEIIWILIENWVEYLIDMQYYGNTDSFFIWVKTLECLKGTGPKTFVMKVFYSIFIFVQTIFWFSSGTNEPI